MIKCKVYLEDETEAILSLSKGDFEDLKKEIDGTLEFIKEFKTEGGRVFGSNEILSYIVLN